MEALENALLRRRQIAKSVLWYGVNLIESLFPRMDMNEITSQFGASKAIGNI